MNILITLFVIVLINVSALGSELINCNADSVLSEKSYNVSLFKEEAKYYLDIDKNSNEVINISKNSLKYIHEYISCGDDLECKSFFYTESESRPFDTLIPNQVKLMYSYERGVANDNTNPIYQFSFNLGDIYSAKAYMIGGYKKFGALSFTVFFNSNHQILGKVLFNVEAMECK